MHGMSASSRLVVAIWLGAGGAVAAPAQSPASQPLARPMARPAHTGGTDLLVLGDGTKRTGTLVGCGPTACRFNTVTVERAQINWIGLGGALPPPPQLDDPSRDVVFLAGGEVRTEALLGVNTQEVVTAEGSYPRGSVRWIHLGPPGTGEQQPTPVPIVAATPPTPATPPPPPSPTPGPPSPTPPPRRTPSSPPGGEYERGALWIGKANGRWWGDKPEGHTELKFSAQVRLREYRYSLKGITPETMGKRVGTMIRLEHEGTTLSAEFHQSGDWGSCEGHGTTTLSYGLNAPGVGHASVIYLKAAGVDLTTRLGFDVPRPGGLYVVDLPTRNEDKYPVECHTTGGDTSRMGPYTTVVIGRSPVGPHMFAHEDPQLRRLVNGDGQMTGSFKAPAVGAFDHVEVQWNICREGVRCSESGGPTGPGDNCPQTTEADSRVETNRAKVEEYAKDLAKRWEKYQDQMKEAKEHLHDFEVTMRVCNVQNWIGNVLIALLAPEGEAAEELEAALKKDALAALTPEEQEALVKGGLQQVAEMVNAIVSGENPFKTMLPENIQTAMELFEVAGKLAAAMQGTTGEKLGDALEECAGTAGITQGQYSSAEEYVEGLKAAVEQLTEVQTLVNNVKQLDNQLPDLQYQAYRACVERARCQGRSDSDCDGLKPPGNWPDVP